LDVAQPKDYVAALPMPSEELIAVILFWEWDLEKVCSNTIANLNLPKSIIAMARSAGAQINFYYRRRTGGL